MRKNPRKKVKYPERVKKTTYDKTCIGTVEQTTDGDGCDIAAIYFGGVTLVFHRTLSSKQFYDRELRSESRISLPVSLSDKSVGGKKFKRYTKRQVIYIFSSSLEKPINLDFLEEETPQSSDYVDTILKPSKDVSISLFSLIYLKVSTIFFNCLIFFLLN